MPQMRKNRGQKKRRSIDDLETDDNSEVENYEASDHSLLEPPVLPEERLATPSPRQKSPVISVPYCEPPKSAGSSLILRVDKIP